MSVTSQGNSFFTSPARKDTWRPKPLLPSVEIPEGHQAPPPPAAIVVEPVAPAPAPQVWTQAQVDAERARVRQEEKDKLYATQTEQAQRLAEFEKTVAELQASEQAKIAAAAAEAAKEARETAEAEWNELSSKDAVEKVRGEFDQRFQALQQEREVERAAFAKEREFTQLAEYARTAVATAVSANELAPELADLVRGNNQQEIDASLELLKAKSAEIGASVAAAMAQQAPQPLPPRGVAPTGYAPTGPMDGTPGTRTLSVEDIKAMDMNEFAKYRGQLLGAASYTSERGMFS